MRTHPTQADAVRAFQDIWTASLADDLATNLTCTEADALADLFAATGKPELAHAWISAHSEGDDQGDRHHGDTPTYC